MKVQIRNFDMPLDIYEDKISCLEIHNRHMFREVLAALIQSQHEKPEYELISLDDGSIGEKFLVVSDVFGFDFASRKLVGEICKQASEKADNEVLRRLGLLEIELEKLAIFAEDALEIELDYDAEVDLAAVLKLLKIEPAVAKNYDAKQRVYGIIDVANRLFPQKIICFVNLKQFLTKDEFIEVAKYCAYKRQLVWLVESAPSYVCELEEIVVADEDLFCYKR